MKLTASLTSHFQFYLDSTMPSYRYQCHFCPEVFDLHSELFKHQRSKHIKKSTHLLCQCAICGMEFLDFDSKTSHIHKKHPQLADRLFQAEQAHVQTASSQYSLGYTAPKGTGQSNELAPKPNFATSNPYKQKENVSRQSQKPKMTESSGFLATLLK